MFTGVSDEGLITSGKIILRLISTEFNIQNDLNQIIPLEKGILSPDLERIFKNQKISNFFGYDKKYSFSHYTDINSVDYINSWKPSNEEQKEIKVIEPVRHPFLNGTFICFSLTKNNDNTYELPEKNIILEQVPIYIKNEHVDINYAGHKVIGNLNYDGDGNFRILTLKNYYTLIFTTVIPGHIHAEKVKYMFGLISKLNEEHPESSAAIMYKVSSQKEDFDHLSFRQFFDIEELIKLDSQHIGLISFLFGDWNRFIRVPTNFRSSFPPKYSSYRLTFWAAACHWGVKYKSIKDSLDENLKKVFLKECKNNIYRAFRHTFAMPVIGITNLNDTNFPEELKEDIKLFNDSLSNELAFPEAISLINQLWDTDHILKIHSDENNKKLNKN